MTQIELICLIPPKKKLKFDSSSFGCWSVLRPAASSGGGSAAVSQGAAGGPAERPAAGAAGGGAGAEKCSRVGGPGAPG